MKNLIAPLLTLLLFQLIFSCKIIKEVPNFEDEFYVKDEIIICYFAPKGMYFKGGDKTYIKHLKENLKYPELALRDSIQGTVYVRLWINKDGNVTKDSIKVVKKVHYLLDAEAVRIVSLLPTFQYNQNDDISPIPKGKFMRLPVKFKINK